MAEYATLPPAKPFRNADGRVYWQAVAHVTRADQATCDYLLIPFDVPEGMARLAVRYQFSGAVDASITDGSGNVIDIGIWDPRGVSFGADGFRGWSGSDRRFFVVGQPEETTPGYVPGPIQAGLWHVVLGLYQVRPDGCEIELEIEAVPLAAEEDVPVSPDTRPRRSRPMDQAGFLCPRVQGVLRPGPGWYRGDLQTHTNHSDAPGSLQELAAAARAQGLDFVAVTDHNTVTSWPYLAEVGSDDLLLIPAEEITTYYGHANVWGSRRWHDFRLRSRSLMAEVAAGVRAAGGLFSINHPRSGGPPWELGTDFEFDCLEVWNGRWEWGNDEALALWERLLRAGRRVVAVGGSDRHQGSTSGRQAYLEVGQPTTWVYAPELSVSGILAGLRAGRVCVSNGPTGPRVELEAEAGGRQARMGERLAVRPGEPVTAHVRALGATGCHLRLVVDGETRGQAPIEAEDITLAWTLPDPGSYIRAQVEGLHSESLVLVALSNPVWLLPDPSRDQVR